MAHALEPIGTCEILKGNVRLTFHLAPYTYTIARSGARVNYQVSDGKETIEFPLEYAFGQGKAGQTYVFSAGGKYYESRVSYYAATSGLDVTVGATGVRPTSLMDAAGRVMDGSEPRKCFGCHTTGARIGVTLQLANYEAGVQCEACHGPGESHVAAIRQAKPSPGSIRSLGKMTPQQSSEFCGSCHRTWEDVALTILTGSLTARFPAYRITSSPCYSLDDPRISCVACHDPHGLP